MENSKTRKIVVKLCLVNCELPNSKTTIFDNSKIVIGKYIHIVGSKNKIGMVRAYLIDEGILEPTHNHPSPTTVDISPTPIPQDVLNNLNKSATLFIASMRPESDQVISSGSGGASLKLSSDESVAIISFDYSRLTSMITSKHIHGPANSGQNAGVLFDFDTEIPQKDGTYVWNIKDTGAISKKLIVDAIKNGRTYINLHTSKYPAGEIRGHFVKNNSTGLNNSINPTNTSTPNNSGTSGIIPITIPVAKPQKVEDVDDIVRFLHQSTFGPTEELITKVKKMGMSAFIDEQFNLKPCSHLDILKAQKNAGGCFDTFFSLGSMVVLCFER